MSVGDVGGCNFQHVTKGKFNNMPWALFECSRGVGVCEVPEDGDRWKHQLVVFMPGSPEANDVKESMNVNVHAAAESWDGRPEFSNVVECTDD